MTENDFMTGLAILLPIVILIYFLFSIIKKRIPPSGLAPFSGVGEVFHYYRSAISVIVKNCWLLIVPLALIWVVYLIQFFFSRYHKPDSLAIDTFGRSFTAALSLKEVLYSFFHTPSLFDYGYTGAISGNLIFPIFFVIYALTYTGEIKKLRPITDDNRVPELLYFRKILKSSLAVIAVFLCVAVTAVVLSSVNRPAGDRDMMFGFFLLSLGTVLLQFLSLSLFSLIQGVILFSIKGALGNKTINFKDHFNDTLTIFKTLFLINIIFTVSGSLPALMNLPATLFSFFSIPADLSSVIHFFIALATFFQFFDSLFMATMLCLPFAVVTYSDGTWGSCITVFNFIKNNLLRYLIFIGIGAVCLFIPELLTDVVKSLINPFSPWLVFFRWLFGSLRIVIAVIFYIAMFKLFLEARYPSGQME